MAYTSEGNKGSSTIDLAGTNRTPPQYGKVYEEKFTSGLVEKVIIVDPRLDKSLQINVGTGEISYEIWVTSTSGSESNDILDSSVPWVQLGTASTSDFLSGGGDINKGILAIRILSATVTSDSFKVCVSNIAPQ